MTPYLWIKAAHVASVLVFVGGLFSQSFAVAAAQRGGAGMAGLVQPGTAASRRRRCCSSG